MPESTITTPSIPTSTIGPTPIDDFVTDHSQDLKQFLRVAKPPAWALKTIGGGRLRGMTDIKPAWRIEAMTEAYGLCGVGWKFEVVKQWTEAAPEGQVFAFVDVLLYIMVYGEWSDPIPGNGGNMLVEKEKGGLHSNDEAWKMATTDALSSAMRLIGVGHAIYAGQWTGSKYTGQSKPAEPPKNEPAKPKLTAMEERYVANALRDIAGTTSLDELKGIGQMFNEKSPAIKDAVYDAYVTHHRKLKEKEHAKGQS